MTGILPGNDRWWEQQHRGEDLAAIQAAVDACGNGDQGEMARDVLAQLRAQELGPAK